METDARSEYRRDLPFGVSHSLMLHIVGILFLMGTTWYVVTKFPDSPSVRSTVITIETLVRAPAVARSQTQQQQQQLTTARTASSSSASSSSAPAMTPPVARPVADASHPAGSRTEMSVLAKNMPHVPPASSAKFFTRDAAAVPGTNGASASASGGATNDGSTLAGPGPGDNGENGRAHTGAVWGEEAPGTFGGRAGRGHDDCTPSRGGWFR
jgi:hypothetical protein